MAQTTAEASTGEVPKHTVLNSSFPVLLPKTPALFIPEDEFQALLKREVSHPGGTTLGKELDKKLDEKLDEELDEKSVGDNANSAAPADSAPKSPFVQGLEDHHARHRSLSDLAAENKTLTKNSDITNVSAKSAVVDLFYDLGDNTEHARLKSLLQDAWDEDPLLTLRIVFNARSIHLGKSNRVAAYKGFGWLAENHPLTLLASLPWLVRPVIAKRAAKAEGKDEQKDEKQAGDQDDEDFDMIDADETDPAKAHDVRYGLSHGYWKDLLNILVFAANDQLKFDGDPASLLNQHPDNTSQGKRDRNWSGAIAKQTRQRKKQEQNGRVQNKLKNDPFYRALHISVARLFAEQLKVDKALLDSGNKSDLKKLSLVAKWAPTFGEFHDKHTFILSSIAEILYPDPAAYCPDANNRELYLRHVREHYRKQYASPLRKALSIVERDIAAKNFGVIKYDRIPSLAMDRYIGLFMKKDYERFHVYVQKVAKGTANISGATLLPSTLVSKARSFHPDARVIVAGKNTNFKTIKANAEASMTKEVINGQWNTLVKHVREAGKLQSSIAVCDVSGSMGYPTLKDGSVPMDSAIGLSLLIAEVTKPPFGGGFITFSEQPTYIAVGGHNDARGLVDKVHYTLGADWNMNTNFVAVFEDVILPMAIANNLVQEDMVKQIFVFSDMQFDQANQGSDRWTSSYDRIKKKYADAGYQMPRLIFWNLAAQNTNKPVTMDDVDTALVSGYSQGMLRAFLETGAFEDEEDVTEEEVEDEDGITGVRKVKKKIEPITVVRKAVDHKAYSMLEVVD